MTNGWRTAPSSQNQEMRRMDVTAAYPRYQSGETCVDSGAYEFDGYLDGSSEALPDLDESEISLGAGDVFPPMRHPRKPCFWKPVEGLAEQEPDAAGVVPALE
jgi:hypothetical protein